MLAGWNLNVAQAACELWVQLTGPWYSLPGLVDCQSVHGQLNL